VGLVLPPLRRPHLRAALEETHVASRAAGGQDHPSRHRQEAHLLPALDAVVVLKLRGQGGRDIRGRLVQAPIALLRLAARSRRRVRLDLRPQRLGGGPDLAGDRAGHLCGQAEVGADGVVRPVLQVRLVTQLAVREGVATHQVQGVTMRQARLTHGAELVRRRVQCELGGEDGAHTTSRAYVQTIGKRGVLWCADGSQPCLFGSGAVRPSLKARGLPASVIVNA
jgi:hypothetical protein